MEARLLRGVGDKSGVRERKRVARHFDQQQRMNLLVGNVADGNQNRILQLDDEGDEVVAAGGGLDPQRDFEQVAGAFVLDFLRVHREIDVERRAARTRLQRMRRVRGLDRQVLDVLGVDHQRQAAQLQ